MHSLYHTVLWTVRTLLWNDTLGGVAASKNFIIDMKKVFGISKYTV